MIKDNDLYDKLNKSKKFLKEGKYEEICDLLMPYTHDQEACFLIAIAVEKLGGKVELVKSWLLKSICNGGLDAYTKLAKIYEKSDSPEDRLRAAICYYNSIFADKKMINSLTVKTLITKYGEKRKKAEKPAVKQVVESYDDEESTAFDEETAATSQENENSFGEFDINSNEVNIKAYDDAEMSQVINLSNVETSTAGFAYYELGCELEELGSYVRACTCYERAADFRVHEAGLRLSELKNSSMYEKFQKDGDANERLVRVSKISKRLISTIEEYDSDAYKIDHVDLYKTSEEDTVAVDIHFQVDEKKGAEESAPSSNSLMVKNYKVNDDFGSVDVELKIYSDGAKTIYRHMTEIGRKDYIEVFERLNGGEDLKLVETDEMDKENYILLSKHLEFRRGSFLEILKENVESLVYCRNLIMTKVKH